MEAQNHQLQELRQLLGMGAQSQLSPGDLKKALLATTGYAEPSPADGVEEPMAWWAMCHRRRGGKSAVVAGCVELPGATRVGAQERVAAEVLAALVAYLREFRGST